MCLSNSYVSTYFLVAKFNTETPALQDLSVVLGVPRKAAVLTHIHMYTLVAL